MTDGVQIAAEVFDRRIDAVCEGMNREGLGAFVVTNPDNVRYLTGFPWGVHSYLLVTSAGETVLVVRPTEYQQAVEESRVTRIILADVDPIEKHLAAEIDGMDRVGFEPHFLSTASLDRLSKFQRRELFVALPDLVTEMRAIKEPWEVDLIHQACRIFDRLMEKIVPGLETGMSEIEILAQIEHGARLEGADGFWFPSIVLSGPRSAQPHGIPSARRVQQGDFLKVDLGPTFSGYASDATRTLAFGTPSARMEEVYGVVHRAQLAALDACGAGVPCSEVHNTAAAVIDEAGYGRYFNHPVGHGVWGPPLVGGESGRLLEEGMVITVEPGIYIPGWGGVRIEDSVLITAEGCEILHSYTKDLVVV